MISFVFAVWIGRQLMQLWMPDSKVHELYTAACGLYVCWLTLRACVMIAQWAPLGWDNLVAKITEWFLIVSSCSPT